MLKESVKSKYNQENFLTLLNNIQNTKYDFELKDSKGSENIYKIENSNLYFFSEIVKKYKKVYYKYLELCELMQLFKKFERDE